MGDQDCSGSQEGAEVLTIRDFWKKIGIVGWCLDQDVLWKSGGVVGISDVMGILMVVEMCYQIGFGN